VRERERERGRERGNKKKAEDLKFERQRKEI
jgi:hypothetical protein